MKTAIKKRGRHKFARPKARDINRIRLKKLLESKGYKVENLDKPWRHVVAVIKRDSQNFLFKMATTQVTGKRTQNEFYWNEAVNYTTPSYRLSFTVPKNIDHGFYQKKLFYMVTEFFEGETLSGRTPSKKKFFFSGCPKLLLQLWKYVSSPLLDSGLLKLKKAKSLLGKSFWNHP